MTKTIDSAAILLDGQYVQRWQHRAVDKMVSEEEITVELLVINDVDPVEDSARLDLDDFTAWNLYRAVQRRNSETPTYRERLHFSDLSWTESATVMRCKPIHNEFGNELPVDIIEKLRTMDIAIRFGFGIVVGDALDAPTHGMLSFHHGDIEEYRGRPGGFWEFVNGEESAAVTLQRLTERLDGGEIVLRNPVDLTGTANWRDVQSRLFRVSDEMLAHSVRKIEEGHKTTHPETLGDLHSNPGWRGMLKYGLRVMQKVLN